MTEQSERPINPFAEGGGGWSFEVGVQSAFVVLMLTDGRAPCFPNYTVKEVRLQVKREGWATDDMLVLAGEPHTNEKATKLLGSIKSSIALTGGDEFGEVISAAWQDFQNEDFQKGRDVIALITCRLSSTDRHVSWLLDQARNAESADSFRARMSSISDLKKKKLKALKHHLKAANGGATLNNQQLHEFMKSFHLIGCDLGEVDGIDLSLIHSHISQFQSDPEAVWGQIFVATGNFNRQGGTINRDTLDKSILEKFKQPRVRRPDSFKTAPEADLGQIPDAARLARANLVGSWNDNCPGDRDVLETLLDVGYAAWTDEAQTIRDISYRRGKWEIAGRLDLWSELGSYILERDLERFISEAVQILGTPDTSFQYSGDIYSVVQDGMPTYSGTLKRGLADGLAIIGNHPDLYDKCDPTKIRKLVAEAVFRIFTSSEDPVLWGGLGDLLPSLAEADPNQFLNAVKRALENPARPFDALFSRRGNAVPELLWALATLAWHDRHFSQACNVLGQLAQDPQGYTRESCIRMLTTILMPWRPQTLASWEKQRTVVESISKNHPEVGWELITRLLPSNSQYSVATGKPSWGTLDGEEKQVLLQEYQDQVSQYTDIATNLATNPADVARISKLVERSLDIPGYSFKRFVEILSSDVIPSLSDEEKLAIWGHLIDFITGYQHHRRPVDGDDPHAEEIAHLEAIADQLAPSGLNKRSRYLFAIREYAPDEDTADQEASMEELDRQRAEVVRDMYEQGGIQPVIRFAESLASPRDVGWALGQQLDPAIDRDLLPDFLGSEDRVLSELLTGFLQGSWAIGGWKWVDSIDRAKFSSEQTGHLLAHLPFREKTWACADSWLGEAQKEYWGRVALAPRDDYSTGGQFETAITKLIKYRRPKAALHFLSITQKHVAENAPTGEPEISVDLCVRALLAAVKSDEPENPLFYHHATRMIRFLREKAALSQEKLSEIEWEYLTLMLDRRLHEVTPEVLWRRLAKEPGFFCRHLGDWAQYASSQDEPPEEVQQSAEKSFRLLSAWRIAPGTEDDGNLDPELFNTWYKTVWYETVKDSSAQVNHWDLAVEFIGGALISSPSDRGLWIHRDIATVLNAPEAGSLREAYRRALYNSRGVAKVDPTGKPERDLAAKYRRQAEEVDEAGFSELAATLYSLSDLYITEAEQMAARFSDGNQSDGKNEDAGEDDGEGENKDQNKSEDGDEGNGEGKGEDEDEDDGKDGE